MDAISYFVIPGFSEMTVWEISNARELFVSRTRNVRTQKRSSVVHLPVCKLKSKECQGQIRDVSSISPIWRGPLECGQVDSRQWRVLLWRRRTRG